VTLIIDTAPIVAMADRDDPVGPAVMDILEREPGELVIPAPVSAEIDYLLGTRLGRVARLAFLEDVAAGRFSVVGLTSEEHRTVREWEERYSDLDPGLADLSVVILAGRYRTRRILTFDQRDFRVMTSVSGEPLVLLPADAG
jgi:predicted nucleic acid-binding protein